MGSYWKSPWEGAFFGVTNLWPDYDLLHYVDEWDSTKYAREMLYGLLTTCAIGSLRKEFVFLLPHCGHQGSCKYVSAISLLYTVREPHHDLQDPYLKFPPRYLHKSSINEEDLVVPEVTKCFSKEGVLPKIFPQIEVYNNVGYDYAAIVRYYLHNAVYVGVKGHLFTAQDLKLLKTIIKEATQLEVLILDNWGMQGMQETEFFNEFITYLCSYPKIFSNFRSRYKATPQPIAHWLGQGISELPRLDLRPSEPCAHFFKVGDKSDGLPQKHKYSELESKDQ